MNRIDTIVPLKKRRMTIKSLETMLKDNINVMSKDYITLSSNDKELLERVNELELNQDTFATTVNDLDKGLMKAHKNTSKVWLHLLKEPEYAYKAKSVRRYGLLRRFLVASYRDVIRLLRWLI